MRGVCLLIAATVSASFLVFSCSLITSLDGYAGTQVADAADAARDAPGPPSDGPVPTDGAAADAPFDTAPSNVVFADSFDDAVALPRQWSKAVGGLDIVPRSDAPSGPNVLRGAWSQPQPVIAALTKTVATPGKSSIACRFMVNLSVFTTMQVAIVARFHANDGAYIWLDLRADAWHTYGQHGAPEYSTGTVLRPIVGRWIATTMRIDATGKITVALDGDERTAMTTAVDTSSLKLELGLLQAYDGTVEVLFDDVVCTAD